MERNWYEQTWVTIALLVLFFPVGLYLMWRYAPWQQWIKWAVSGAFVLLFVAAGVSIAVGGEEDAAVEAEIATTAEPTVTHTPRLTETPVLTDTPAPTRTPRSATATQAADAAATPEVTGPCWTFWLGGAENPCGIQNSWTLDEWGDLQVGMFEGLPVPAPPDAFDIINCYADYTMMHYTPEEFLALEQEGDAEWDSYLAAAQAECGSLD